MSTLYIFGNGFDIAHGINTPYSAFREFLKHNHEDFLTTFEAMYNILPLDDTEPWYTEAAQKRWDESVLKDLWKSFEEEIGKPNVDEMHDAAQSMVDSMPSEGVLDTLNYYWKDQYGFVTKLQEYVLEWLGTIDYSAAKCKKKSLVDDQTDLFMSFNYTDTLERIYGIENVLYLHGGIPSCCDTPPIMGHGNRYLIESYRRKAFEAQEESIEWYESICNAIADYCEALYKDTDSIIKQHEDFFEAVEDVDTIVCLGLSFGDVDIPYLERIKKSVNPETRWLIYYYGEESKDRLNNVFGILGIRRQFQTYLLPSDHFWD